MDTKEKIIELLGSLIHPETGEDLVKSGFVEQVNASDEHISVALHFAKARDPFAFKLKAQAEALLREAGLVCAGWHTGIEPSPPPPSR